MKTARCLCGAVAVAVLVLGASVYAQGPEYRWQPASGCTSLANNQGSPGVASVCTVGGVIPGGGVEVSLEVDISDWSDAVGSPNLGTFQWGIVGSVGYISGGNGGFDGTYGANDDLGPKGGCCPGTAAGCFINTAHARWVMAGLIPPCISLPATAITTIDYEGGASILGGCTITDPGTIRYAGTVVVVVPPGAAGTYTIPFNPASTKTFINDGNGVPVEPLVKTSVKIVVPVGQCCYGIGTPGAGCADVSQTECQTFSGPRVFNGSSTCADPCCTCVSDADCTDFGAPFCATGACIDCVICVYTLLYDPETDCCDPNNPGAGNLTPLDDGNPCTDDMCDRYTGEVSHTNNDANACEHPNPCVVNDHCVAGACVGDLPFTSDPIDGLQIACVEDVDCPAGWFCNVQDFLPEAFCDCRLSTPLCIEWVEGEYEDVCCFDEGDTVNATVTMGAGTSVVTGGQFLIEYDPACLEFVAIGPCEGEENFLTIIDMDHTAGLIWYAMIALDPMDPEVALEGTTGPADLACIEFIKKGGDCAACSACLISENPRNTLLVNDKGQSVTLDICTCEPCPRLAGDITLNVPDGAMVDADCGAPTAIIEWDAPSASDSCDGVLEVECAFEHTGGVPIDQLLMGGGEFPQGTSYFICEASNSCGKTASKVWTVSVSDQHAIDVEVHLSPTMNPGAFSRCICFDLYADCASDPTYECRVMDFGPPYNFPAHADGLLKVDKGNYLCIAAYDPLHTICAEAAVECIDNMWSATFKGDPLAGGNWLIGGNLYNDVHIDIFDAGTYMAEIANGASYANGNTTCDTPAPHGDINADGAVDSADYTFIVENFLAACKSPCCDDGTAGADSQPVLEISVKELRAMGLGNLAVADLNGDGVLNTTDMDLYMQGVEPIQVQRTKRPSR